MSIPDYTDNFGIPASFDVNLGSTSKFLTWATGSKVIKLSDPETTDLPKGDYVI